jgi:hypothetical protein
VVVDVEDPGVVDRVVVVDELDPVRFESVPERKNMNVAATSTPANTMATARRRRITRGLGRLGTITVWAT